MLRQNSAQAVISALATMVGIPMISVWGTLMNVAVDVFAHVNAERNSKFATLS